MCTQFDNIMKLYVIEFETCHTYHFQITGENILKMFKKVTWVGVYGPHTQVKCLLFFGTCK